MKRLLTLAGIVAMSVTISTAFLMALALITACRGAIKPAKKGEVRLAPAQMYVAMVIRPTGAAEPLIAEDQVRTVSQVIVPTGGRVSVIMAGPEGEEKVVSFVLGPPPTIQVTAQRSDSSDPVAAAEDREARQRATRALDIEIQARSDLADRGREGFVQDFSRISRHAPYARNGDFARAVERADRILAEPPAPGTIAPKRILIVVSATLSSREPVNLRSDPVVLLCSASGDLGPFGAARLGKLFRFADARGAIAWLEGFGHD